MAPNAIMLFHFDEPDGVLPSDSSGNLDDLNTALLSVQPLSVDTYCGKGRHFVGTASEYALVAPDLAGQDTLLQRDMTVQAILAIDDEGGSPGVMIARGLNSGAASEYYSMGIEFFPTGPNVEARWFWQDSAGVVKKQPPAVWKHLGDGKFFLFTATRRWVSAVKVVTRYYIGPDMIAEFETVDGDIAGATTAHTTIGARQEAGVWEDWFDGIIDELLVTDHEMSPAEVRHTWRRIAEFQPGGVDTFVGLSPPGLPWAKDLSNAVGRHVKHAGEALGFVAAGAEELRAMWLPDQVPLGTIERWERFCQLSARPGDSIETRQARLVGHFSREEGFHHAAVRAAMKELAGVEDASLLELLEFTNRVTDDFTTLNPEKWMTFGDGGGSSAAIVANALKLTLAAGSDVRWLTKELGLHTRMPLDRGDSITVHAYAKLVSHALADEVGSGLFLLNRITNDALYFGVYKPTAAAALLVYMLVRNGIFQGIVQILDPAPASAWLRITPPSSVAGQWTLSYSTLGPNAGFVDTAVALGDLAFDWSGFGMFGIAAASGAASEATFDDHDTFCPHGLRPFSWYVYRNPALIGAPDVDGAHLLARKIRPAHTYAGFTQSKSVMPDSARDGLPDRGPCGGW